jgi:hypothetical protein
VADGLKEREGKGARLGLDLEMKHSRELDGQRRLLHQWRTQRDEDAMLPNLRWRTVRNKVQSSVSSLRELGLGVVTRCRRAPAQLGR